MITVEEYLGYCDSALDGYADIVRALGDDLVNSRLDGVPGVELGVRAGDPRRGDGGPLGAHGQPGIVVPRDRMPSSPPPDG